jgi:TPR repeat protein
LGLYYSLGIGTDESNEKAFDCYYKAANLGHIKSQCKVADCFCSGCGTEKDISKALEMYRKAAENDNTYAQYKLGEIYYYGDEGYKDETKGLEWFQLVAKKDWSLDDQEKIEEAAIVLGIEYFENNDVSTAINWLLKASENDNSDAQYLLGYVYENLDDYQNAVTWYLKAANAGHKRAQFEMGQCYFKGMGVSEDFSIAAHWFEESINNQSICRFDYPEDTDIQLLIGCCYFLLQSFDQSREWLTRSANQGNNIAVYYLGQIEKEEGNLIESFTLFTRAAENGDADAQYELGDCYYYGSGTDIDYAKAVKWYTKAAKSGDADAQYQLGVCYENGLGVDKDEYVAFKWYEQAANSDHIDAQYQLGKCYENGVGVEKDDNVAFYWYEQAAKSGHTDAQCQLGDCYDSGIGVKVHYPTAAEWYTKAAENGNTDAQLKLGRYFALGYGVKRNYSKAIDYYKQAVDKGDITAQLMLGLCYRLTNEYTESFKWYEKAAENGSQEAQYFIAECYYSGLGTEKDYLQTFQILNALVGVIDEKMVTYGDIFLLLGECYENGRGTEQNLGAAITTYKVIADRDYEETEEACYRIGKIYYDSFKMGRPIYSYTNTSTSTAANVARIITDVITPIPVTLISNYINKKNKMTEILKTKPGETMVSYFEKAAKLGHEDSKKIMKELNKYR